MCCVRYSQSTSEWARTVHGSFSRLIIPQIIIQTVDPRSHLRYFDRTIHYTSVGRIAENGWQELKTDFQELNWSSLYLFNYRMNLIVYSMLHIQRTCLIWRSDLIFSKDPLIVYLYNFHRFYWNIMHIVLINYIFTTYSACKWTNHLRKCPEVGTFRMSPLSYRCSENLFYIRVITVLSHLEHGKCRA